ncbi:MBOAT family O-acyltransferase [Gilvimarinus sp. F26214L]|uniref:MBOAT family O-acyltransferase n=1 Tax=Gilvimarinus sp. DZF01 TaxID=3461371 RepID=UPI004045EF51
MLFNSFEFIFLFLPVVALGFYLIRAHSGTGNVALGFLVLASLFFYGWWDPRYLLLILASILVNFSIGRSIISLRRKGAGKGRAYVALGVGLNLAALGYFKYSGFLLGNLGALTSLDVPLVQVVLPLAISFFTFQQIAYLVDAYRGQCDDYDFVHYCLFVTFFPQLIAGPIVHHSEMMPQFLRQRRSDFWNDLYLGVSFFSFGLCKKVLIADEIAQWSTPVFAAADGGMAVGSLEAWGGAASYSLQLYFDFSGYADMAIGAALMFGIRLPLNFNSPYKALSIIDFWRRWHMTLSRFLRDYLYIPLGGNRNGKLARYRNLLVTMLLGGLWHGAGWNFIIWGGLHGLYLVANHLFRILRPTWALPPLISRFAAWLLTTVCVLLAWVFFRAESLEGALGMVQVMFTLEPVVSHTEVWTESADSGLKRIAIFYAIAVLLPNTQQLLSYAGQTRSSLERWLNWRPNWAFGLLTSILFAATVLNMSAISEFLYFRF